MGIDVEAASRAMTPAQRRRYLTAAGWRHQPVAMLERRMQKWAFGPCPTCPARF